MLPAIGLRGEQDADEAFVAALYAGSRADEMARVPWPEPEKAAFLRMQFALQRTHYRTHYRDATFSVVLGGEVPIGRLYVQRAPEEIRLIEITLLPAWRGRGIGGDLVRDLLDEAAAHGKRVVLHAERNNPARRLYLRLGFQPVADVGLYDRLEWSAGSAPAKSDQAKQPG
jgi:ribosomal protein S18 acetylase RimI-like enzyme